ncbi:MAG: alpha/beta hydrolase [Aestuariivirga sp.]
MLQRDGAMLRGRDGGEGLPVIFQHGLGGDEAQVAEVFPDGNGLRRLTLECRGQGSSESGDPARLSIANFADDVLAFADSRQVQHFVIGGISMGAAIALRIAIKYPERVSALILARPAWLWGEAPENMAPFVDVARHLRDGTVDAFESSPTARRLAHEAPDNLQSLKKFLLAKDRAATAALLSAIATDGPGVSKAEVRAISLPTLIIGHKVDAVHPLKFAHTLAGLIRGSQLVEITPKASDKPRHVVEFRAHVEKFLLRISKGKT